MPSLLPWEFEFLGWRMGMGSSTRLMEFPEGTWRSKQPWFSGQSTCKERIPRERSLHIREGPPWVPSRVISACTWGHYLKPGEEESERLREKISCCHTELETVPTPSGQTEKSPSSQSGESSAQEGLASELKNNHSWTEPCCWPTYQTITVRSERTK